MTKKLIPTFLKQRNPEKELTLKFCYIQKI